MKMKWMKWEWLAWYFGGSGITFLAMGAYRAGICALVACFVCSVLTPTEDWKD